MKFVTKINDVILVIKVSNIDVKRKKYMYDYMIRIDVDLATC
jgi:hypothetical protein